MSAWRLQAKPGSVRWTPRAGLLLAFLAVSCPAGWPGRTATAAGDAPAGEETAERDGPSLEVAREALRRATVFFRHRVAEDGGYLWRYSADLAKREGEGEVTTRTVWVQPPGTPTVGEAFLDAWRHTGDPSCLLGAREAADVLLRGQLRSGGWTAKIELEPGRRKRWAYRVDPPRSEARDVSSLDDDMTQSALRFLLRFDRALGFTERDVHEAVTYALDRLLAAQYPNGAWPQGFRGPREPGEYPVQRASYPGEWSRTPPRGRRYWRYYTLNDNVLADTVDTLLLAHEVLDDPRCMEAVRQAGEFLRLAQMPDPQPGWAQQYDFDMHPAWARRFEPPAVTGGESEGACRTLIRIFRATGEPEWLEPVPRALEYFRDSKLPNGRLARFYELRTNRPLYFTKEYLLTYDAGDVPGHYSFEQGNWVDDVERAYRRALAEAQRDEDDEDAAQAERSDPASPDPELVRGARRAVRRLDERGAWVEDGRMRFFGDGDPTRRVIECRTFARNLRVLGRWIAAIEPSANPAR